MTVEELEVAVLQMISIIYEHRYNKNIKVTLLKDYNDIIYGYGLRLAINQIERPITIFVEGSEDHFLEKVAKELHERNLVDTKFYTGYKVHN